MTASLEVPNELISRARRAGVNCSAIARNAIEDAVQRMERRETGDIPAKSAAGAAPVKVDNGS